MDFFTSLPCKKTSNKQTGSPFRDQTSESSRENTQHATDDADARPVKIPASERGWRDPRGDLAATRASGFGVCVVCRVYRVKEWKVHENKRKKSMAPARGRLPRMREPPAARDLEPAAKHSPASIYHGHRPPPPHLASERASGQVLSQSASSSVRALNNWGLVCARVCICVGHARHTDTCAGLIRGFAKDKGQHRSQRVCLAPLLPQYSPFPQSNAAGWLATVSVSVSVSAADSHPWLNLSRSEPIRSVSIRSATARASYTVVTANTVRALGHFLAQSSLKSKGNTTNLKVNRVFVIFWRLYILEIILKI